MAQGPRQGYKHSLTGQPLANIHVRPLLKHESTPHSMLAVRERVDSGFLSMKLLSVIETNHSKFGIRCN